MAISQDGTRINSIFTPKCTYWGVVFKNISQVCVQCDLLLSTTSSIVERYFKSSSKENPGVFTRATFGFFVLKIEIRVPEDNQKNFNQGKSWDLHYCRYYFDSEDGTCKLFYYGGCEGNKNNFKSLQTCQSRCSVDFSIPIEEDFKLEFCFLAMDEGTE